MKKLGVIVPYRDRPNHLKEFRESIIKYLDETNIPYEIIVVEQDDDKLFNRGMLLNIGFQYAKKLNCDYVVFHDIDMLPIDVDYSYSDKPIHLAYDIGKETFDTYFGGVTMFPVNLFEKINGYSNKYWGWGYEDDDLLLRCKKNEIPLDEIQIKNYKGSGKIVRLNGTNAYIKGKNVFNFNHDMTLFISFFPYEITCDTEKDVDIYPIFNIPSGYDFSISYNSFSRYNFCTFDSEKKSLYVNSNIKINYKTNICITVNHTDKKIDVYQDGVLIGSTRNFNKLFSYARNQFFYIGVNDPNKDENKHYFRGHFDSLILFSDLLSPEQIYDLSNNYSFGNYQLPSSVKLHYDAKIISGYKFVDLSGNENDGEIVNCEILKEVMDDYFTVKIPYRRKSKFRLLDHEENGFFDNKWKNQCTRWNQLRYINEVSRNHSLIYSEGLNDVINYKYKKTKVGKVTQIKVVL